MNLDEEDYIVAKLKGDLKTITLTDVKYIQHENGLIEKQVTTSQELENIFQWRERIVAEHQGRLYGTFEQM